MQNQTLTDMKKFITIIAFALGFSLSATAQNNAYQSTIGFVTDASGEKSYISPSTIVSVDITVEKEQNIVGPYARYAQKYLNVRGSLVEKSVYRITAIDLGLAHDAEVYAAGELPQNCTATLSHNGSTTEFAKILPDRLTNSTLSLDDAAMEAAQAIFDIRKHRMELITGEAGENVFGGGLKDALDALDKQENALLELFFGKNIITTTTERYYIEIDANTKDYTITDFSKNAGIDQQGEAVTLHFTPTGKFKAANYANADPKAKSLIPVRVADLSRCEVKVGGNPFPTKINTLPVFEFGQTIYVAAPAEK